MTRRWSNTWTPGTANAFSAVRPSFVLTKGKLNVGNASNDVATLTMLLSDASFLYNTGDTLRVRLLEGATVLVDRDFTALGVGQSGTDKNGRLVFTLKTLAIFTISLALTASTPMNTTLQAAASLRVPGRLVHLAMLTHRYLFLFAAELGRLRLALRVRGYRNRPTMHCYRTIGNVAGTLLVRSSERGERVAQAMRCRGFDGRFRSLTEFCTRFADVAGFIVIAGGYGALVAWEILG